MTSEGAAQAVSGRDEAEQADSIGGAIDQEVRVFMIVFSTMLRETVLRFGQTAERVTDMIMTQPGSTHRDMVMTLQEFDRLQQEFVALGGVLDRFVTHPNNASSATPSGARFDRAISGISLSEIKERFSQHPARPTADAPPETFDEVVF